MNFAKPEHVTGEWKKPAYFGVFDGHGGMECADYLRDNLHTYISKEKAYLLPNKDFLTRCKKRYGMASKNARNIFLNSHMQAGLTNQARVVSYHSFMVANAISLTLATVARS